MIQVEMTHMQKIEKLFVATPKEANLILGRAINRAATAAKTRASVSIRKKYVTKSEDIKSKIKIIKANRNRLSSQVRVAGPVMPLMKFDVTPSLPDVMIVRARVKKGGMKPVQHGFVRRVTNKKSDGSISTFTNAFVRSGKGRYPIRGLYGPSIAQMMGSDEVVNSIENRAGEVLNDRLRHEFDRLLRG